MNIYQHVENFKKDLQNRYLFWREQIPRAFMTGRPLNGINFFLCGTTEKNKNCSFWITKAEANKLGITINELTYQTVLTKNNLLNSQGIKLERIVPFKIYNLLDSDFIIKYGDTKTKRELSVSNLNIILTNFISFHETNYHSYYRKQESKLYLNTKDCNCVDAIVDYFFVMTKNENWDKPFKRALIKEVAKTKIAYFLGLNINSLTRLDPKFIDDFLKFQQELSIEQQITDILKMFAIADTIFNLFSQKTNY